MRFAVPCEGNRIAEQIGHAPQFIFFDANLGTGTIESEEVIAAPPVQPALLPRWLATQRADVVLAMGIATGMRGGCAQLGVDVVAGLVMRDPRKAVEEFLGGMLKNPGGAAVVH
jgi:predicted Fe-Mo cluster-binding NifX family protein